MKDFIEISQERIIKESKTEAPDYCGKPYIVYMRTDGAHKGIHVNTYFYRVKSLFPQRRARVRLCIYYDRKLCDTLEEYNQMPAEYIERQAYNSWMDGAH